MSVLNIKIKKLKSNAIIPTYQTDHSAGMDLCACIDKPMIIKSMCRMMVPTGLSIELPVGFEAQIRARSGLSIKNGITMVNGVGTIDADYRGEIGMLVVNLSKEDFTIEPNMRIAQMVISKYEKVIWQEAVILNNTERGNGGFGSTGK